MRPGGDEDNDLKAMMEGYLPPAAGKQDESYKQTTFQPKKKELSKEDLKSLMESVPEVPPDAKEDSGSLVTVSTQLPVLDLHLMTVGTAIELTIEFLDKLINDRMVKRALIITGKGLGSPGFQSRIKPAIEDLLRSRYRHDIQQVRNAPPDKGGSGALMITFR